MLLQTFRASHEHYSEKSNYTALMHCCLVNLLAKLVVCCPLVPDATNPNKNIKVGMSKMGRRDSSEVQRRLEKIMVIEMMKVHFIHVSNSQRINIK